MTAATTKIATCYDPSHAPGTRRLIEIRRDNTTSRDNRLGRYVCTQVHAGVGEDSQRCHTEAEAYTHAARLGYTDVLPE